jgi:hypothetical protein
MFGAFAGFDEVGLVVVELLAMTGEEVPAESVMLAVTVAHGESLEFGLGGTIHLRRRNRYRRALQDRQRRLNNRPT